MFRPSPRLLALTRRTRPHLPIDIHKHVYNKPPEELQFRVRQLYRDILRVLRRLPPGHVREETYDYARGEFDRNIAQRDPEQIAYFIISGSNEFKQYRSFIEDYKHFAESVQMQSSDSGPIRSRTERKVAL